MSYPDLVIERPYAQWCEVTFDAVAAPQMMEMARASVLANLFDYCADHHLRVVSPVEYRVTDSHIDFRMRGTTIVLAECKAQGLPPVEPKRRWWRRIR